MTDEKKSIVAEVKERLFHERKNGWDALKTEDESNLLQYNDAYKTFLDSAKTEREGVESVIQLIEPLGYRNLLETENADKSYFNHYGKSIAIYREGKAPLDAGLNILVAHLDSPRLDLKQYPLYEDTDIVFLKTHYYGGIKKYQWLSRPLAIHGVVVLTDGTKKILSLAKRMMIRFLPLQTCLSI
jgi:aspartyl aminopeptidase